LASLRIQDSSTRRVAIHSKRQSCVGFSRADPKQTPSIQTIPDKQLAAVGAKRNSCLRVLCFGVALQYLPGTELVLTLTSGMASVVKRDRMLRLVKAPQELHAFHFLMAWHPRHNTDPRHVWFREAMRSTIADLNG
jgi:DNA-binding transcriptional LysR family regulator